MVGWVWHEKPEKDIRPCLSHAGVAEHQEVRWQKVPLQCSGQSPGAGQVDQLGLNTQQSPWWCTPCHTHRWKNAENSSHLFSCDRKIDRASLNWKHLFVILKKSSYLGKLAKKADYHSFLCSNLLIENAFSKYALCLPGCCMPSCWFLPGFRW